MILNRKMLAQLATRDGQAFRRVVELIKETGDPSIQSPSFKTG